MIRIVNPIVEKALQIANEALKGRNDKAGNPCILHKDLRKVF